MQSLPAMFMHCAGTPTCCRLEADYRPPSMWRWGISIVFTGQLMVFSLGYNNTPPADRPLAFSSAYWLLHGGLCLSSVIVLILLGQPLGEALLRNWREKTISLETLFGLSLAGALSASLLAAGGGVTGIYYEIPPIVLLIYHLGQWAAYRPRQKMLDLLRQTQEDFSFGWVLGPNGSRSWRRLADLDLAATVFSSLAGERVSMDGEVLGGRAYVRESAVTGEPGPVAKGIGSYLLAGSILLDGEITYRATSPVGQRRIDAILAVAVPEEQPRTRWQKESDHLMRWFVPFVASIALLTVLLWRAGGLPLWQSVFRGVSVLLVACPCALGLATPLSIWMGRQRLAEAGLLVREARLLEILARADRIVFDKTGTLSLDRCHLAELVTTPEFRGREEELRQAAALLESGLPHPLARAFSQVPTGDWILEERYWQAGLGVEGRLRRGQNLAVWMRVGEPSWAVGQEAPTLPSISCSPGKHLYLSVDGRPAAVIRWEEIWREDLCHLSARLRQLRLQLCILSGDSSFAPTELCSIPIQSGLTPQAKADCITAWKACGETVLYVGDGWNDTPAALAADAAIAMAESPAMLQESCAGMLLGDRLSVLVEAIERCRRLDRTLRRFRYYAIGYNLLGLSLAAAGLLQPVTAALIMAVSSTAVAYNVWKSAAT